jgi:hypothetical protein
VRRPGASCQSSIDLVSECDFSHLISTGVCEKGGLDEVFLDVTSLLDSFEQRHPDEAGQCMRTHVVGGSTLHEWSPACSDDERLLVRNLPLSLLT